MASKKVQVPLTVQEAEGLLEKLKELEHFIYYPTNILTKVSEQANTVNYLHKKVKSALSVAKKS